MNPCLSSVEFSNTQKQAAEQSARAHIDLAVREKSDDRVVNNIATRPGAPHNELLGTNAFQNARTQMRQELTAQHQQSLSQYNQHMMAFRTAEPADKFQHLAKADLESTNCYPGMVPEDRLKAAKGFIENGTLDQYKLVLTPSLERSREMGHRAARAPQQPVQQQADSAQQTPAATSQESIETRFNQSLAAHRRGAIGREAMQRARHGQGRDAGVLGDAVSSDPARRSSARKSLENVIEYRDRKQAFMNFREANGVAHASDFAKLPEEQRQQGMHLFSQAMESRQKFIESVNQHRGQHAALDRGTDKTLIAIQSQVHDVNANQGRTVADRLSTSKVFLANGQTKSASEHFDRSKSVSQQQSRSASLSR